MNIVLNTYGASLNREEGLFLINTKEGSKKLNPDKIRSISIGKGARISSDAALLAIDNEIDVYFIDKSGKPSGRLWSVKYGSISAIRRKQLDFIKSQAAIDWVKDIVVKIKTLSVNLFD